jgi:hypothetical protein
MTQSTKARSPNLKRATGYAAGAGLASLIYVTWIAANAIFAGPDRLIGFSFGFAVLFWLVGGFALALILTIAPWAIAVWAHRKAQWPGEIYFPVAGALLVFTLGCAAISLAPTPFFVDDQTFLQGALIAAERQGICMLLAGAALGLSYWWLGERRIPQT